jgi:dolichol-phosphate mannosyltransferase
MKYSVVVPAFNEQEVLPLSYPRLKAVMDTLGDYEIIFVNDGSRDDTLRILKEIADKDKTVRAISFSRNFGHQEAVSAGMAASSGQAVIIIDCDLQDPPEVIPEMVKRWQAGADIVYGLRTKRRGESAFKKLTAWLYYRVLRSLGGQFIPANTGDFRLIDRKVCDALNSMPEKNRFLRGMAAWSGFTAEPCEYVRDERAAGKTKYSMRKMLKLAGDGITSFSNRPLKFAMAMGISVLTLSLLYLVVSVVLACLHIFETWHILFAVVFGLLGFLFISLGIIGLYLGRIYDEAKGRPIYIIDEKINFTK